MIFWVKQCLKEVQDFPEEIRGDLADALCRLDEGHMLNMPLSRPIPSIGTGVHELRLKDRSGIYRVIYYFAGLGTVWILHGFTKKTQAIPRRHLDIARKRIREVGK